MLTADTINRIIELDGNGLPIVSLYARVPFAPGSEPSLPSRVDSLLGDLRPVAEDRSIDREARLSVRGDIERIQQRVRGPEPARPGALAIFSCSGRGIYEELDLPREVRDRVVLDATPWVRTMLAVLDECYRLCVVVVDRSTATAWELYQDEMRRVRKVRHRALRQSGYAEPLAEHRVRNKADELAKRHFREVAVALDELFRTRGYDLLAVGGHEYEVPKFLEFLPRNLRERIAGTFTVDTSAVGIAEVQRKAAAVLTSYEREEERVRVAEVVETVADGGRAALGVPDCLWAGTVAAIDRLLVEDGAVVSGVVCDSCGWMAEEGGACPLCGRNVRKTTDVLDELTEEVIDEGGSVKHVKAETELRRYLVGASLRFPLPPMPEPAESSAG